MEGAEQARVERRLAAILAADVAGYGRLMEQDEAGTLARLNVLRCELIDDKIAEHRGRIVKTTGDGMLVEFHSVVDAVRCAAEVQRGMIDREVQLSDDQRIKFRIGINLGDVIAEGGPLATASMSRRDWKRWPSPAASASPVSSATRSATSCPSRSMIWASRASKTLRARCGSMRFARRRLPICPHRAYPLQRRGADPSSASPLRRQSRQCSLSG